MCHKGPPLLMTLCPRKQGLLELLSSAASGCEQVSLCDAGSRDAFHTTHEVSELTAVPAAHLSLPSPLFGGGFSHPCCLSSLPLPSTGPF